jgi:hypothetical protein
MSTPGHRFLTTKDTPMSNKYGPHGEDVEAFLAEVEATTDPAVWDQLAAGIDLQLRTALVAAGKASSKTKLSASVDSAIDRGSRLAYRNLHLTNEDLPHAFFGRRDVYDLIGDATLALALGDRLASEHRQTFLGLFATAGFASVLASHAWTSLDTNTDTSQHAPETPHPTRTDAPSPPT